MTHSRRPGIFSRPLNPEEAELLVAMAGYRNRPTHFYEEVTPVELYEILTRRLGDVEAILAALLRWIDDHPERLDRTL